MATIQQRSSLDTPKCGSRPSTSNSLPQLQELGPPQARDACYFHCYSSFPTNSCVLFQGELVWLEAMNCLDYIAKRKHEDCTFQCQFRLAGITSLHVTLPFGRDKNHHHQHLIYLCFTTIPSQNGPSLESVQELHMVM
jgi:hypothetical protein